MTISTVYNVVGVKITDQVLFQLLVKNLECLTQNFKNDQSKIQFITLANELFNNHPDKEYLSEFSESNEELEIFRPMFENSKFLKDEEINYDLISDELVELKYDLVDVKLDTPKDCRFYQISHDLDENESLIFGLTLNTLIIRGNAKDDKDLKTKFSTIESIFEKVRALDLGDVDMYTLTNDCGCCS